MVDLITELVRADDILAYGDSPTLVPASAHDIDILRNVRKGELLSTTIKFDRNLPHQRKYWAMLKVVGDGCGIDPKVLHVQLKIRVNLIEMILLDRSYGMIVVPASTSFPAMDQTRFQEYFLMAVDAVFDHYIPRSRAQWLWDQVDDLVNRRAA